MTSSEFKTWLQGFLDGCGDNLTTAQLNKIKNMLNKVVDLTPCIPSFHDISKPTEWIIPSDLMRGPTNPFPYGEIRFNDRPY